MRDRRRALITRLVLLPWLLLVVACGGGGDAPAEAQVVEPTGPGRLERATQLNRIALANIQAATQAADFTD